MLDSLTAMEDEEPTPLSGHIEAIMASVVKAERVAGQDGSDASLKARDYLRLAAVLVIRAMQEHGPIPPGRVVDHANEPSEPPVAPPADEPVAPPPEEPPPLSPVAPPEPPEPPPLPVTRAPEEPPPLPPVAPAPAKPAPAKPAPAKTARPRRERTRSKPPPLPPPLLPVPEPTGEEKLDKFLAEIAAAPIPLDVLAAAAADTAAILAKIEADTKIPTDMAAMDALDALAGQQPGSKRVATKEQHNSNGNALVRLPT